MAITRVAAVAGAALMVAGAAPAAMAQEYPPTSPTEVAAVCVGDIPFMEFAVDFGADGQFVGNPMTITFVNPGGEDFVIDSTVPAPGQSRQVLWPGASVDPQDWPGWVLDANGVWVESTTDPGAFTRAPGGVEVQFATNPTLTTNVVYPPATAVCANPENPTTPPGTTPPGTTPPGTTPPGTTPPGATPPGGEIPQTGGSVLPALLGGGAVAIGAGMLAASRRGRTA